MLASTPSQEDTDQGRALTRGGCVCPQRRRSSAKALPGQSALSPCRAQALRFPLIAVRAPASRSAGRHGKLYLVTCMRKAYAGETG